MKAFGIAFGISVVLTILEAFVLNRLWEWFVVPTFGGPTPNLVVCIGLSMIATNLRPMPMPDNLEEKFSQLVLQSLVRSWMTLIVAFLLKWFV